MCKLTNNAIRYCEEIGIYEVRSQKGNVITYYSYYGSEGFVKVQHNIKTGKERRIGLKYKKIPKFLLGDNCTQYNYFVG